MSGLIYYKRNVGYSIGVRSDIMDRKGMVLTTDNPYYAVKPEALRDFKMANKRAILEGLIIETTEPSIDWDTSNAISDDKAIDLVKNYMALKNELPKITSLPTLEKILAAANDLDRPTKTVKLIEARMSELTEDEISINDMRGTDISR